MVPEDPGCQTPSLWDSTAPTTGKHQLHVSLWQATTGSCTSSSGLFSSGHITKSCLPLLHADPRTSTAIRQPSGKENAHPALLLLEEDAASDSFTAPGVTGKW